MPKEAATPSPYDSSAYKTERTAVAVLMHWMRQIIEKNSLDLGMPDVETGGADRRMPDLVIYRSRRSNEVLCVGEAKQPFFDVFDEGLKDDARKKANRRRAIYFFTTNFRELVWWKTEAANRPELSEAQQIVNRYHLSEIADLNYIEQARFSEPIKQALKEFLARLFAVATGREAEPKLPVDELLVFRLHERIRLLARYYKEIIRDQCHKDRGFAKDLAAWFNEQNWSFNWQETDFDRAARQTAYLLVNKILFYHALQAKRPGELDPLIVPESLTRGGILRGVLQSFFEQVLKIDYETIYTTDFIDSLAFPDRSEVVSAIVALLNALQRYDFSTIGFDIIGRIFERLIPEEERHNLGQYFTNPDIVDIILRFCLEHEEEKILDPACGAGTFLVRAYQHKKIFNQRLTHEEILETLWGNDIAKFPAHLATINLAICDLSSDRNYPNIIQEDFFALQVGSEGFDLPERTRVRRAMTLGKNGREITYPRWFDVVVGNPPYTRQEEIPEIGVDKVRLIQNALKLGNRKIAEVSKRAGIHAYFFVHGTKFLKDGGKFGFIVSNSWLDVEYGKGLQEFFLNNYKIIAVIESKVELWFEDADINTCIVILKKCADKQERDNNLVRFVFLKKPLRHFIPPAQGIWEKQLERLRAIDALKRTILAHDEFYENEELRIFPKSQKELYEEGFDPEEKRFVGAKWGKYLRAPEIFFKILEKGKGKFVPLKQLADVRRGFTTGANEFFYLTEDQIKRWGIERQFWMHKDKKGRWVPNYVIKSPKECKSIIVKPEDLKYRVLMIHKNKNQLKGTNVLRYILAGERKGYDSRPTCASRGERWYELPEIRAPILSKRFVDIAFGYFLNPQNFFVGDTFFVITPKDKSNILRLGAFLNCTLGSFFTEIYGRTVMGEGVLLIYGPEIVPMPVVIPKLISDGKAMVIKRILSRPVGDIFTELGAISPAEVSLDKVKPDRRELDKIIMGDILGLTEEEQLEVYRAVIDLVKSRIERAKSVASGSHIGEGMDVKLLTDNIIDRVKEGEEK